MFKNLLRKLLGLFKNTALPLPKEDYPTRERTVFKFWNGEKEVTSDPMTLYKAMLDVWPELVVDIKLAASPSKDARKGWDGQIDKVRKIFSVKPFAEGGLTEVETMDIFYDFWGWCEQLKKNSLPSPISLGATSPSSESTYKENPATSNTSPSGSTKNERSTAEPAPAN